MIGHNYNSDLEGLGDAFLNTETSDVSFVTPPTLVTNDLTNLPLTLGDQAAININPLTSSVIGKQDPTTLGNSNPLIIILYIVGGIALLELFKR